MGCKINVLYVITCMFSTHAIPQTDIRGYLTVTVNTALFATHTSQTNEKYYWERSLKMVAYR